MDFNNLESFIVHFAEAHIRIDRETNRVLEVAAKIVEKDAKARLGHYQEAIGPYGAWMELSDYTKRERAMQGYTPNDPLLRSGKLRASIEHEVDVNQHIAIIGSKSEYAEDQELGTSRIPARPFIGPAAFANKQKIRDLIGRSVMNGLFSGAIGHYEVLD